MCQCDAMLLNIIFSFLTLLHSEVDPASNRNLHEISLAGLPTLAASCADSLEIPDVWNSWRPVHLSRPVMGELYLYVRSWMQTLWPRKLHLLPPKIEVQQVIQSLYWLSYCISCFLRNTQRKLRSTDRSVAVFRAGHMIVTTRDISQNKSKMFTASISYQ